MKLNAQQLDSYSEKGFLLVTGLFTPSEIEAVSAEIQGVLTTDHPGRILEKNGMDVRSVFAVHQSNEVFGRMARLEKIVGPVKQLLNADAYIYQAKLNSKKALSGDCWEWHQDFPFWHFEDGLPRPNILTAMIFLNDVTEFSGPLYLVPGSHKVGIADFEDSSKDTEFESEWFKGYQGRTEYMSHLTAKLKYTISNEVLTLWMDQKGIYSAKASAGSVLFFHGNVFHSSPNNLSQHDRHTFLVTYNSVENKLPTYSSRPDFLCSRDYNAVEVVTDITPHVTRKV